MMIMMMMDWFLSGLAVASTRVQLWRGRERHQRARVGSNHPRRYRFSDDSRHRPIQQPIMLRAAKSESPLFIVRQRWPYGERR